MPPTTPPIMEDRDLFDLWKGFVGYLYTNRRKTYDDDITSMSIAELKTSIAPCCAHGIGEEGGGPVQEGLYQGSSGDLAKLRRELN